ncbi:MAG: hypothetical protein RI967_1527 [Planctomycetota bacterium]
MSDEPRTRDDEAELDRLRALGAMVVHDLGNAIFAITGRTQLLERRAADDATKASAREILGSVRMLEELLARLRVACRGERAASAAERSLAGEDAPVAVRRPSLREVIARALADLPSPGAALVPLAELAPSDARCEVSPDDLSRAIVQCLEAHARWGLASPAARLEVSTEDDPTVTIRLESRAHPQAPDRFVAPSLLAGEPALEQLGLLAAQRAIREVGGRVAWSVVGEGTARLLTTAIAIPITRGIPLELEASARARGATAPAGAADPAGTHDGDHDCDACLADARPRRVLIADDDPAVRAILVAVLESVGDDVDTIDDPSAIVGRDDLASFDVAILDAGGGGLGALDRLRALGNDLPVLLASGDLVERADDPLTRTALKPFDLKRLDHALATLAALRQRG